MLYEKISGDIVAAMKAKDKVRLMALRSVKKYFLEAKTAPAAIYAGQSRQDLADEELAQVAVIEEYLPQQLTADELKAELQQIIAEVGATSARDMGKVMGAATKKLSGRAEGRAISAMVKELLA